MPAVPAAMAAPAPVGGAQITPTPALQEGVPNPATPTNEFAEKVEKAFNAGQMSIRLVREMQDAVNKLADQIKAKQEQSPKAPVGVEERITALQNEVEAQKRNAAKDRLDASLVKAANEEKVSADRMEFLEFRLKKEHGERLTAEGIPDPTEPSKWISVATLVKGLLNRPEGAIFRSAPTTAALPSVGASAPGTVTDGLPEFSKDQFEKGLIPKEIRNTGLYRIKE